MYWGGEHKIITSAGAGLKQPGFQTRPMCLILLLSYITIILSEYDS